MFDIVVENMATLNNHEYLSKSWMNIMRIGIEIKCVKLVFLDISDFFRFCLCLHLQENK